jgi:hypothetical protein
MNYSVRADDCTDAPERLTKLIEERERLTLTIEVSWQCVKSSLQSALSGELLQRGQLTAEREQSIRATVLSKDQSFLDSLHIELDGVKKQIASLMPEIDTGVQSMESPA